jgi:hypothetical protein
MREAFKIYSAKPKVLTSLEPAPEDPPVEPVMTSQSRSKGMYTSGVRDPEDRTRCIGSPHLQAAW